MRLRVVLYALATSLSAVAAWGPLPRACASDSDPQAIVLAESVLEKMGGREAWEQTRFLTWRFGRRLHHWDRWTGDVRIESDERLVLMNVHTKHGRVWEHGVEVTDADSLRAVLDQGHAWWINDSYWLIMPYKLLDPGVRLRYRGESALENGRPAEVLTLTFAEDVGLTPQNKYDVWVASDTGLVEQWAFYSDASDPEPKFVLPWADWKRFGDVLLATSHGRDADWEIAAPDEIPRSRFESP